MAVDPRPLSREAKKELLGLITSGKLTNEQKVQLHFNGHFFFREVFEVRASRNMAILGGLEEKNLVEYADRLWYVEAAPKKKRGPRIGGPKKPTHTGPKVTKK